MDYRLVMDQAAARKFRCCIAPAKDVKITVATGNLLPLVAPFCATYASEIIGTAMEVKDKKYTGITGEGRALVFP